MIGPAFQSTPPGNSGGDLVGDRPAHLVGVVSIHAPETQGAMQSRLILTAFTPKFQSTPPGNSGGDLRVRFPKVKPSVVSIHARREGPGEFPPESQQAPSPGCFNPRLPDNRGATAP